MSTSAQDHIAIRKSSSKLVGLVTIGAILVAAGVWLIQRNVGASGDKEAVFWGWLGIMFFGSLTCFTVLRLIFGHRKPVELSPQGFRDRRVFKHQMPWTAVTRMSLWSGGGRTTLCIHFTDEAMRSMKFTFLGRAIRWLHMPFGLDFIFVPPGELDISYRELRQLFKTYLAEHNPTALDETF